MSERTAGRGSAAVSGGGRREPGRGAMRRAGPLLAAVVLLAAAGCGERSPKTPLPSPVLEHGAIVFPEGSQQLGAFTVDTAREGAPLVVQLAGRLVWNEERTVRLYPPLAGRVVSISARPGDAVAAGAVLATLASPEMGQAQSDARKTDVEHALMQRNLARLRELHAAGVAAHKDVLAAETDLARAEAERQRTQALLRLHGGTASVNQSFALRSPIAGVVVERHVNPGQELRGDMQLANTPPMFVVTDPSRLWVQLEAHETDLPSLARGKAMKLRASAWPEETFHARIESIADYVDPQTRTIRVRASVDNRERRLKGEMYVSAEIESPVAARVQVPANAVFLFEEKHYVFVQSGPRSFRRVEIRLAGQHGDKVGVASGLEPGERVVTTGNLFLLRILRLLETGAPV